MTTVVEEDPYAATVITGFLKNVCSNCFNRDDDRALKQCSRCKTIHYCCADCQKKDWPLHKSECIALVRVAPRIPTSMVRLMARLLTRHHNGDTKSVRSFNDRSFDDLMDHSEALTKDPARMEFFRCVANVLKDYVPESLIAPMDLLRFFGRIVVNCFNITGDDEVAIGEGVFVGLSALDHSCAPDAFVRFRGKTAMLRTPREGAKFSNSLTIPYAALDTLNCTREKELRDQYYFTCTCAVCRDGERDGYARSIRCKSCSDGVCLVPDEKAVLACVKCAAIADVGFGDAMHANQEIEWHLGKVNTKEKWNGDYMSDGSIRELLESSAELYRKHESLLSHLNLPLASLAYKIVNIGLAINIPTVRVADFADKFTAAYKRYLPRGHPQLSSVLQAAAMAAACADPPSKEVLAMFHESREAFLLSHGPRDPETARADQLVAQYTTRLAHAADV